jgi:Na+-driven multidrug efflux pump
VFPLLMLMQMMSAGAMGGGISSAIARALGAGRRDDADALALHALAIGLVFGAAFTLAVLGGGGWLYRAMGGHGPSLAAALTYSRVIFAAAIPIWTFNSLANVIRGTGNMAVPAIVTSAGAAGLIPLRSRRDRRLRHRRAPRVPPGPARVRAGWAPRRDGRDQHRRRPARARAAWVGAAIAAALAEAIGLAAAAAPRAWLGLFDTDTAMLEAGSRYLHTVGPFYGLFGLGMALYFASQGAGRLLWPLLANLTRLVIAAGGGWLALRGDRDLAHVFLALSVALAAFGVINASAVAGGAWFGPIRRPRARPAYPPPR